MDKINEVLTRGVEKIYPSKKAFEKVLRSGKKIRVYQGFDPSMPNLHLGNAVGLWKLKQFQDLGHEVIFLIGDFTGMIGDPTDKLSTRKQLTSQQVLKNCRHWQKQAGKVLNFGGSNPVKMRYNSQWLAKLSFADLLQLCRHLTYQQIIKREMFRQRLKKGQDIFLHEFLYPVMQGYDSVVMDVDLEIGGADQMFNMLVGRDLMKKIKNKEKFVMTTKLLVDSQGEKVGKTAGNALFLNAPAGDMFGAIMAFPDEAIIPGFELLTAAPIPTTQKNPMALKKKLAREITKTHHGEAAAQEAQNEFERVFQKQKTPAKMPIFKTKKTNWAIVDLLVAAGLASSKTAAKRLVKQGAIDLNGQTISNPQKEIKTKNNDVIRCGKRKFIRIKSRK